MTFLEINENKSLVLGENQFIYLLDTSETKLFLSKIGGTYTHARFVSNNVVVGITKGVLDFYQISNIDEKNRHQAIFMMSFDAHFMDITRFFLKGIPVSINIFHLI